MTNRVKSLNYEAFALEESFLQFPIYLFVIFNSKDLNSKRDAYVLRFLRVLKGGGGGSEKQNKTKQKKTSDVFLSISLEWLNNALFGKEITIGLAWACHLPQCFSLSETWMSICPFII